MAHRIDYVFPVESMRGKFANDNDKLTIGRSAAFIGRKNSWKIGGFTNSFSVFANPYGGDPTSAQVSLRTKFKTAVTQARSAIADPEQAPALIEAYNAQTKYKTLFGYVMAQKMKAIN